MISGSAGRVQAERKNGSFTTGTGSLTASPGQGRREAVRPGTISNRTGGRLTADGTAGDGRVALDVTFEARTPAIGGDGQQRAAADASSAATRQSVGKGHLEQGGCWSGWIEVAGARAMFDGVGSPVTQTFGLGLSGAKRLSSDFDIHSRPGEGTRVTIVRWR